MRRDRRTARGFSLIELVIAMTVFALVAGICYAAFYLGLRATERGEAAVVTAQRLRAATDVIVRQIRSTVAQQAVIGEDEDTLPYFVGTPTSMSFVTVSGQLSGGGRARVTYRLETDPPQLEMVESPHFDPNSLGAGTPEATEPRSAILLDGFVSGTFEYLYDDGSERKWQTSWSMIDEEMLPSAVRIIVDGLPGFGGDAWGAEIPLIVGAFGEGGLEGDPDAIAECDEPPVGGAAAAGTPGAQGTPGQSDDDGDDGEDDE